jgi:type VI secretion system protein ImpE
MPAQLTLTATSADPFAAVGELQDSIRKEPGRSDLRIFLFQILCLKGDWVRANTQLDTLAELDKEALSLVQTYREAIKCEVFRKEVFAGPRTPLILGDPVDWLAWLLEAVRLNASGHHAEAAQLRERAFDAAPQCGGAIDGQPFAWIADADMRIGPVLEAIIDGKYYWVPFDRLNRVEIEPPVDLRDLVWLPATLTFANGGENVAFLPARYPGSELATDNGLKLARRTEWQDIGSGTFAGLGQRMLATDAGEYPLLDIRSIALSQ